MLKKAIQGIEKISKMLDVEFSYSTANHNFELGIPLENALRNFFIQYFPSRFGFTSGYLVDKEDRVSNQLDWIIYDSIYFPPLMGKSQKEDLIEWVPFDGAYGSVEVKRTLNEDSLEKAVKQIKKTKSLNRNDVDLLQVNPLFHISKKKLNIREDVELPICNYYYSGIYAYTSEGFADGGSIIKFILSLGVKPTLLPDFIAIHGNFFIKKMRCEENVEITPFLNKTNAYGVVESGIATAGIFYSDLITQFSNTKLAAFYQMNLVQNIMRELGLLNITGHYFDDSEKT